MATARCSSLLLVAVALLASSDRCASSKIRLEGQGYVGVVVAIHPRVPEDPGFVDNLKELLSQTSAFLHRATRQLVYLKEVTIVLPHTWSDAVPHQPVAGAMLSDADVRVLNVTEQDPYTLQPRGCGELGEYIVLPFQFVRDLRSATERDFKKPAYVLTHEWAHLRFGVFDEFGAPGDEQYPAMYFRDGQKRPTTCSESIVVSPQKENGDPCDLVEGSSQQDCLAFSPLDEFTKASSSIMFMPPLSSVYTFCDDATHKHNAEAPTPHNAICDSRSTWDVVTSSPDLKGVKDPVDLQPTSFRIVKAQSKERMLLVLDISVSMGLDNKIYMMHRAASRFIQDTVPDGTKLGIVAFSTDAEVNAPLTEVTNTSRTTLVNRVPFKFHGVTAIGKALLTALGELGKDGRSVENSIIILMTDGEENQPPYISEVTGELQRKRVVVNTLALGKEAEKGLEDLAKLTGGKSFAVTDEKRHLLDKLDKSFFSAGTAQLEEEEKPVTLIKRAIPLVGKTTSLSIMVDRELGKNLDFIASGADGDTTAVTARSPSGKTYVAQYDQRLQRHKLAIKDADEPGQWQVEIKRHDPSRQDSVTVTVTSEAKDPDHPPIRVRTFFSTSDLSIVRASTQFKIFVELKKGELAVKGAHVLANVTTPLGGQVPVWLKDNGVGADIAEGDGVYSAYFSSFTSPGRYSVEIQAYGDETSGTAYPKRPSLARRWDAHRVVRRDAEPVARFERYDNGGAFVVRKVEAAVVYPPAKIRDLRVLHASYMGNGTRLIGLSWTSPGAHLDEGTCSRLRISVGTNLTTLTKSNVTSDDIYFVSEDDVFNGTLVPSASGEVHHVAFSIPTSWLPPNDDAHDVHFVVTTWNSEGYRSKPSNVATANFFKRTPVDEGPRSRWEEVLTSKAMLYFVSALLVGVLFAVVVILVVNVFRRRSSVGVERVAVFRCAPVKAEFEKASRSRLLASLP